MLSLIITSHLETTETQEHSNRSEDALEEMQSERARGCSRGFILSTTTSGRAQGYRLGQMYASRKTNGKIEVPEEISF